jgi:hypothetical protein
MTGYGSLGARETTAFDGVVVALKQSRQLLFRRLRDLATWDEPLRLPCQLDEPSGCLEFYGGHQRPPDACVITLPELQRRTYCCEFRVVEGVRAIRASTGPRSCSTTFQSALFPEV